MRKYCFLMLCCVILTVLLSGCSDIGATGTGAKPLPSIRVGGTIYEPYFYKDVDGRFTGIDVELAKEAFRRLGYEPQFVEVDLSEITQAFEDGTIDCFWSCYTMETREDDYLWAGPYLYTRRVVVVKADSDMTALDELEHKSIAVQSNSMMERIFLNKMSPDIPQEYELYTYRTIAEAFTALRKGYVDAVGGHEAALGLYTSEYPNEYRYLNISLYRSKLGVAFEKDSDQSLVNALTMTLKDMSDDGTTRKVLENYHLDISSNLYGGEVDEGISE